MSNNVRHPHQPVVNDIHGTKRFKENAICSWLINGSVGMNEIAKQKFSKEDRIQFAQLIGYSVSGWAELSYVDDDSYSEVVTMMEDNTRSQQEITIAILTEKLDDIKSSLRDLTCTAFNIAPEDLVD